MASSHLLLATLTTLALVAAASAEYAGKPFIKAPVYIAKPKNLAVGIQVQGTIYCRKYGKLSPLAGAMARLTCIALSGAGGHEASPFSVVSKATDGKGYFKINLAKYHVGPYKLAACKVFLETPPPGECSVATDAGLGVSGAPLSAEFRVLHDGTKLFSIAPFVYTIPKY